MLFIFFSFSLFSAMSLLFSGSPLIIGLALLVISSRFAIIISFSISAWFAIVLFLVYVGGILVIFAYFSALQPNQIIDFSFIQISLPLVFPVLFFSPNSFKFIVFHNQISDLLFRAPILLIFFGFSLFLAIVFVVKIASASKGALRPFFYDNLYYFLYFFRLPHCILLSTETNSFSPHLYRGYYTCNRSP